MRRFFFLVLFIATNLFAIAQDGWRPGEMQVRISLRDRSEAERLKGLSPEGEISSPDGKVVTVYVTPDELLEVQQAGLSYVIEIPDLNAYSRTLRSSNLLDGFFNYTSIVALADSLSENFPAICHKYLLGSTPQGRQLAILKISDNVMVNENEPEVMFEGGIHGDELMGPELVIRYARDLCLGYGTDPVYTDLVNSREIWMYYLVNPDGYVSLSRYNSAGVDCNRDCGYMWNGEGNSPGYYSQPESRMIRNLQLDHNFTVFTDYHGGTEIISYPWSYRTDACPDDGQLDNLAAAYSNASGYANLPYGQGYNVMYQIFGSTKDCHYGSNGQISWSIEVSTLKQPPVSQIGVIYSYNVPAMTEVLKRAGWGMQGVVTDSLTGLPVAATVWIDGYYPCYTDPEVGDYHKYILAGSHNIRVSANGYETKTITGIMVSSQSCSTVDFSLVPDTARYAYKVIATRIPSFPPVVQYQDESYTPGAVGAPDGITYSLGRSGWIILDMGDTIFNGPGADFKVWAGSEEGYTASVSPAMDGPWTSLGTVSGTATFDLASSGITKARYIKILDDGDGSSNVPDAGFDLDAIGFLTLPAKANFVADNTTPCSGTPVSFTDHSSGDPVSWNWEFPGATPAQSTDKDPSGITYSQAGVYPVTLTVANGWSSSTLTREAYIGVSETPSVNLGNDTLICLPYGTTLDAGNPGCSYLWSTGDTTRTIYAETANPANITYSVTVTAPDGCTGYDDIQIMFVICDGVGEPDADSAVSAWPNPGPGCFMIGVQEAIAATYSVYDLFGRKVLAGELNGSRDPFRIDLSDKPRGIYILTFTGEKKLPSLKLVKY